MSIRKQAKVFAGGGGEKITLHVLIDISYNTASVPVQVEVQAAPRSVSDCGSNSGIWGQRWGYSARSRLGLATKK